MNISTGTNIGIIMASHELMSSNLVTQFLDQYINYYVKICICMLPWKYTVHAVRRNQDSMKNKSRVNNNTARRNCFTFS